MSDVQPEPAPVDPEPTPEPAEEPSHGDTTPEEE